MPQKICFLSIISNVTNKIIRFSPVDFKVFKTHGCNPFGSSSFFSSLPVFVCAVIYSLFFVF